MLVFWVSVVLIIAIVLLLILPALIRPELNKNADPLSEKRSLFRQQFEELDQDKNSGVLDPMQYEVAKTELERQLLGEMSDQTPSIATPAKPDRILAVALVIILPLISVILYLQLGSPISVTIPSTSPIAGSNVSNEQHNAMAGKIDSLLDALKKKLEQNPGNAEGWALLARSYVELRRHSEALPPFQKALELTPDDPQLLADYADALGVVNGNSLDGKPEEMVNRALKIDPHHVKSLLLGATIAFNHKDYKTAILYWERLQSDLPAGSDLLPDIQASLKEASAISGIKLNPPPVKIAVDSKGISGTVRLAPSLADKLDPNSTLFVFARATQGPPIPLAIVRASAKDLPYSFHLDDSMALMTDHKLSQANEVVLVARLSKSGDAKSQGGDLQGITGVIRPDVGNVDIEINQVVP